MIEMQTPRHMSARKASHREPDARRTCKAVRGKMTSALNELALLHSRLPMSREEFTTQIQRIADEHTQPSECELHVLHISGGLVALRIKAQQSEFHCGACKTTECFFHPHTE
jgi:hypothetical protein